MAMAPINDNQGKSTRPYLVRALHDWCTDNGFTPYVAVHVDASVQVPMEYVKNNEIVLNVSFEATSGMQLGNEAIEFKARFGGVTREIVVPMDHVVAIYARENGQGMAFPMPTATGAEAAPDVAPTRGLRLASTDSPSAPAASPMAASAPTLAPAADAASAAEPSQPPDPDPSQPPPTGRPSLKRIK
jgi:stringent starvation protein B